MLFCVFQGVELIERFQNLTTLKLCRLRLLRDKTKANFAFEKATKDMKFLKKLHISDSRISGRGLNNAEYHLSEFCASGAPVSVRFFRMSSEPFLLVYALESFVLHCDHDIEKCDEDRIIENSSTDIHSAFDCPVSACFGKLFVEQCSFDRKITFQQRNSDAVTLSSRHFAA